ncbi:MAG: hypothetical protein ACE5K3_07880 [bacterium]
MQYIANILESIGTFLVAIGALIVLWRIAVLIDIIGAWIKGSKGLVGSEEKEK